VQGKKEHTDCYALNGYNTAFSTTFLLQESVRISGTIVSTVHKRKFEKTVLLFIIKSKK
jgi:hypothetical protein